MLHIVFQYFIRTSFIHCITFLSFFAIANNVQLDLLNKIWILMTLISVYLDECLQMHIIYTIYVVCD